MRLLHCLILATWLPLLARGAAPLAQLPRGPLPRVSAGCVVCGTSLTNTFYLLSSASYREKQLLCADCAHLETRCASCSLPVRPDALRLDDGRYLCAADARLAVFNEGDLQRVFEETKQEVMRQLANLGSLPDRNVRVQMSNATELERLNQSPRAGHDKLSTLGLTRTRRLATGKFEHTIYLISGLGPQRLAAVCAHEYTHTWLHENVGRERQIDGDTEEAFCELVAFRLMAARHEDIEQAVIRANAYTRGQIDTLIQAEDDYRFYELVRWLQSGVDERIDRQNLERLLVLKAPSTPALNWPAPVVTPAPDTLRLKGIVGRGAQRLALINDCPLARDESSRIRVGPTNALVRCVEIFDNRVVVQVNESTHTTELFLRSGQ